MVKNEEAELALHLFKVLSQAYHSVIEHSIRLSKKNGFNPTEFAVLELLYQQGPQPLQVIGSRLLMVSGGVTYVVDKLEKSGLLYRQPCCSFNLSFVAAKVVVCPRPTNFEFEAMISKISPTLKRQMLDSPRINGKSMSTACHISRQ